MVEERLEWEKVRGRVRLIEGAAASSAHQYDSLAVALGNSGFPLLTADAFASCAVRHLVPKGIQDGNASFAREKDKKCQQTSLLSFLVMGGWSSPADVNCHMSHKNGRGIQIYTS